MPSKVSVIIPTYNRASYLAQAIRSVQAQSYTDVEIIVADDGSTDDTPHIVSQLGSGVVYLPLPHRGQPAVTRNAGLRAAEGEYVAFLDSDDLFLPAKLALQLAALEQQPEAGLVYSNAYFFRDDPALPTGHALDGMPTPSGEVLADLLRGNFLTSPAVLIRQACLKAVGPFDENPALFVAEDYELWLRVAARFTLVYVPGDVAAIRRQGGSVSGDIAALRNCALLALKKLERSRPDLRRSYATAFNEGYARNHGAIAAALFQRRKFLEGVSHAAQALRYSIRTPGMGTKALWQWAKRRRARGTAAIP